MNRVADEDAADGHRRGLIPRRRRINPRVNASARASRVSQPRSLSLNPRRLKPQPRRYRFATGGQPPDKIPAFGVDTPMGRPGQPAELAGIYVLLASAESSYATGQVYGAVGGRGGP